MIKKIVQFYKVSTPSQLLSTKEEQENLYKKLKWQVFISATIGYGLYYVCRLSLNVVKKTYSG